MTTHDLHRHLAKLAWKDTTFTVFGAKVHRYQLNARLTESQLRSFEWEHGVELLL
jgi:hypothetical protein